MRKWVILISLIALISCAQRKYYSPISSKEFAAIENKQDEVKTVLWKGKISIRSPENRLNGDILVIAERSPLNVKIEITNWLSGPIFYIFLKNKKVCLISSKERKAYIGTLKDIGVLYPMDILLPKLDQHQIWTILRALPKPIKGGAGLVYSEKGASALISKDLKITYRGYYLLDGIPFAKEIYISSYSTNTSWNIRIDKIQFNQKIPQEIFKIRIPPSFQTIRYQPPSS